MPAPPTTTAPLIGSDAASSSATTTSAVTRASTIDKLTSVLRQLTINHSEASTTGPSPVAPGASPFAVTSLPQLPNSQLMVTVAGSQPSITVTPNTPVASYITAFPSSMPKQNGPVDSVTNASVVTVTGRTVLPAPTHKVVSGDAAQPDSLAINDDASQATSSHVSDASSNEDQSYYDDLVYDQTADLSDDNTANGMIYLS